jgi:hypothetical protein
MRNTRHFAGTGVVVYDPCNDEPCNDEPWNNETQVMDAS